MFLIMGGLSLYVYGFLALAIAPAIALMVYVYRQDRLDKEPAQLLWRLVTMGVIAAAFAGILEEVGMATLGLFSGLDPNSARFTVVSDFLVVGVVEEGLKYALMARQTWSHPAFNARFDGVVYAVFTSLGFAATENVMYGLMYGPGVLFGRALMAIPAHMGFAVLFGMLYGEAKLLSTRGHDIAGAACIVIGYVRSVFLHGLYDSAAMVGSEDTELVFLLVVAAIYVIVFCLARVAARHDRRFRA